ncbi:glycosyltransferase family 4 protein [Benzoatithermus flavus]|uniref:Glycosyltransferase family 4 protein n=1 Tax=Benzoatithermus flavus TaxID=3108223 RepID=A0ABU8XVK8_9PROT
MTGRRRLVLAFPGALTTRTGGYVYDRRLAVALEARGWAVRRLSLPAGFPFPSGQELAASAAALAALPDGASVLVDGLAFGAMPEIAARESGRLDLVALVHHPLCLETGLAPAQAAALAASERRALAHARSVVVTSPRTATALEELFAVPPRRIRVALPGTDPAPAARGSGGPGCRMVCVATVTPRKGHVLLVEALAGLADLDWELLCAGSMRRDPATAQTLAAAVATHGLEGRVHLLGEIDEAAVGALYDRADLCVSASLHEGYGMALAEALARGLPIVAAAGGAVADTVPAEAGLLVPPGDVPALRAALRRFLDEPGLAARLRIGALAARTRLPRWSDTAAAVEAALLDGRA